MHARKLGFHGTSKNIESLNYTLLRLLPIVETDMTLFYRLLAKLDLANMIDSNTDYLKQHFRPAWYIEKQIDDNYLNQLSGWLLNYSDCLRVEGVSELQRSERMNSVNPLYVPRNYLAQLAIDKVEQGDYSVLHEMLEVLKNPYSEQEGMDQYAQPRPEWARHRAGCSMLSCSS